MRVDEGDPMSKKVSDQLGWRRAQVAGGFGWEVEGLEPYNEGAFLRWERRGLWEPGSAAG